MNKYTNNCLIKCVMNYLNLEIKTLLINCPDSSILPFYKNGVFFRHFFRPVHDLAVLRRFLVTKRRFLVTKDCGKLWHLRHSLPNCTSLMGAQVQPRRDNI